MHENNFIASVRIRKAAAIGGGFVVPSRSAPVD
jgi:hypothetical protein